jgi:serine/threonine protein kinase
MVPEIPHFDMIKLGMLGSGSFADVYEVKLVRRDVCDDPPLDRTRTFAIKMLRGNPPRPQSDGNDRQEQQANDLAKEAVVLSRLPHHDNVIALLAVSEGFFADPRRGFLILERLAETLQDVLERWRKERKLAATVAKWQPGCRCRGLFELLAAAKANRDSMARRETLRGTEIGTPLTKAMEFLHQNDIIF